MEIDKIIADYLSGQISENDQAILESWLDEDPSHRDQFETLQKVWNTSQGYPPVLNIDDERQKLWEKLTGAKSLQPQTPSHISWSRILKIAAAILILVTTGIYLKKNTFSKEKGVTQTLAQIITRENPPGQKSKIQLPDGSTIWLNAGSSVSYFTNFNSDNRDIQLKGEAYFEVAKNKLLPFTVRTKYMTVTAIGTSFNIQAFDTQKSNMVALNTGKVQVECFDPTGKKSIMGYLAPGEFASYSSNTGNLKIEEFQGLDPFGWKDGRITFNHASFGEVTEVLARWYNVEINIQGELHHEWNYTSVFENEVLENILESLKYSEKIEYEINGSIVNIKL